tara:strand:- start:5917 stop:7116 length:1200 start_codon:yes stop_codon:yes gene_type:complete
MAFNLQGFGAGFASTLTSRINEDRIRQEKIQDEARTIATRQRLAKQAEREQEQKIVDELTGSLGVFFSPDEVTAIMKGGVGAAKQALTLGQNAAAKGMSASPLINIPDAAALSAQESSDFASEVLSSTADLPPIESGVSDLEKTQEGVERKSSLFNLDYYGQIMSPADDEQATLDSAYAIAVQKSIAGSTKAIRDKNAKLADLYLDKIKEKDAALKTEGTKSSPFSKSSITAIANANIKNALQENQFSVDLEGRLAEKIGDRVPEYNVALIQAARMMTIENTGEDGKYMSLQLYNKANAYAENAVKNIKQNAKSRLLEPNKAMNSKRIQNIDQPIDMFATENGQRVNVLQKNAQAGVYSIGDIILVNTVENGVPVTRIKVYTGINISPKHNNFIDAGIR